MLTLVTGLPGAGKTLWTLAEVERVRASSGRPVFYHNINELKLPWHKLESGRDWATVPDGSIVVLDECQQTFPPRATGGAVPGYVEAISTHRHRGVDVYLISQDALQFDAFVRRLVGHHVHIKRVFGLSRVVVMRWEGLGRPGDYHSEKLAVRSKWVHDRKVFDWYKSAEIHTVQKRLPWVKLGGLAFLFLALAGLTYFFVARWSDRINPDEGIVADVAQGSSVLAKPDLDPAIEAVGLSDPDAWATRTPDLPFSAPAYMPSVEVVEAPKVAGCMLMKVGNNSECRCATQQGTDAGVSFRTCMEYVHRGVFRWDQSEVSYYPTVEAYVPPLEQSGGTFSAEGSVKFGGDQAGRDAGASD